MGVPPARRWPLGFLGMLALVLAAEAWVARWVPRYTPAFVEDWREAGHRLQVARDAPVIALGDSLVKNGVLPAVVEARLGHGRKVYNLAISGSPVPVYYFLLRRMVEAGHAPEAILVDGQVLSFSPRTPPDPLPWHALLTPGELVTLSWSFGDPHFFALNASRMLLPSLGNRATIRPLVVGVATGWSRGGADSPALSLANWTRNRGCLLLPDRRPGPHQAERDAAVAQFFTGAWACDRLQDQYVRRFLALAEAHHVRVYWLVMPAHPVVTAVRERDGWWTAHLAYLRGLQQRHPNLAVIDAHRAGYPSEAMADVLHLSHTGAVAFSDAVGEILAHDKDRERWVEPRRYDAGRARALVAGSPALDMDQLAQAAAARAASQAGRRRR